MQGLQISAKFVKISSAKNLKMTNPRKYNLTKNLDLVDTLK